MGLRCQGRPRAPSGPARVRQIRQCSACLRNPISGRALAARARARARAPARQGQCCVFFILRLCLIQRKWAPRARASLRAGVGRPAGATASRSRPRALWARPGRAVSLRFCLFAQSHRGARLGNARARDRRDRSEAGFDEHERLLYCAQRSSIITAFISARTNLSPFTKGCRERDASM